MTISRLDIDYSKKELTITADAGDGHTIAAIKIDSCNTFNCTEEASTKSVVVYTGEAQQLEDYIIDISLVEGLGTPLGQGLFFFYIYVDDGEAGFDSMYPFYDADGLLRFVFNQIKREFLPCDRCSGVSDSLISNISLYFGIENAIKLKEYRYACDFLKAIYLINVVSSSNCGCHGR